VKRARGDFIDFFRVTSTSRTSTTFTATVDGRATRTYVLERRASLDAGPWTIIATVGPLATAAPVSLPDPNSPEGPCFYQIRASAPSREMALGTGSLFAAEKSTQIPKNPAELRSFSGHHVVDHPVVGGGDLRFHEFRNCGDRLVGHFLAESKGGKLFFEFVHGSEEVMKVPGTGLEPAHLAILDPKSSASTNSAIPAFGSQSTGHAAGGKHAMSAKRGIAIRARSNVLVPDGSWF
jgi:hypothetical protein